MKQIKHIAFIMLMSMISINCFAYDITVENEDGVKIYYNYINDNKELEVTSNGNSGGYRGNVKIPSDVTYAGRTRKVTSIGGHAFSENTGLTSVTIPNSVTSIGQEAFYGCSGLTSVTIPNSVTTIGSFAFYKCSRLEKVIVKDITAWCNINFEYTANPLYSAHHLYSDENTEITDLVIPNSVTSIGQRAFECCTGLTSVTIPNSVTSIRNNAFEGCSGLTSIIIPNSVKSIGNLTFDNCI